ncbi:MAG TPA: DUF3300 domain-containing protein [Stellaceae bacterium]|nr:DUF3300 domain-containing protein [Stellaceae bacterium]
MYRVVLAALAALLTAAPAFAADAPPPGVGALDAALAPVALYPDTLLTPLLMAATYPDEVAEADGWLGEAGNAKLRGDPLTVALEPRPWAPSVKALVPFPVTLDMLASRAAWMKQLGEAEIADPARVAAEIQHLRRLALATGKLKSGPRLTVRDQGGFVVIAAADPAMVYVPVYNPALVYGAWAYPDFPPVFIEPPRGFEVSGADIETGIGFSVGFGVLAPLWNWAHLNWATGAIAVDTAAYSRINRYGPHEAASVWRHEAHGGGYFHITQDQVTPVKAPPAKGRHAVAAAKKSRHEAKHDTKHAAKHARAGKGALHKAKVARGHVPTHRGKVHVASDTRGTRRDR